MAPFNYPVNGFPRNTIKQHEDRENIMPNLIPKQSSGAENKTPSVISLKAGGIHKQHSMSSTKNTSFGMLRAAIPRSGSLKRLQEDYSD